MRILIAEDEKDLLCLLKDQLSREGHVIFTAENGEVAWEIFKKEAIDLCILDVMMPVMDGYTLIKKIREKSEVPAIFLTARGDEMDRVMGFALGADDYLVKPFSMIELKARVQVQVRHIQKQRQTYIENNVAQKSLSCGALYLNLDEAICYKNNEPITLSAKEYLLLKLLMENIGHVFTKRQLYNAVWKEDYLYDDNTIMVHLSKLRAKIEEQPKEPEYLVTIRGIGYKLVNPSKAGDNA